MRVTKLALNVVVIGKTFTTEHFEIIKRVHGQDGEITIKPLKFFTGQDNLLNFIKMSTSTVYVTDGVDKTQIEIIKDQGLVFGDLSGSHPLWYNVKSFGDVSPIYDITVLNSRKRGSYCGMP